MNENKYKEIVKSGQEPEYISTSLSSISSIGTENSKNSGSMPFGSAILTDAGSSSSLKNQGINHIIHATPMPEGNNLEDFVEAATKAIQNSIILAERAGIRRLATCFLGGKIYCRNESSKAPLAEGIIKGALNQLKECPGVDRITFVDYDGEYYKKAFDKIRFGDSNYFVTSNKARSVRGDLCQWKTHECEAIVNSENTQMIWGDGISGAIQKALGSEASKVDQQRKDLMKEFVKFNKKENDDSVKNYQFIYEGETVDVMNSARRFFSFVSQDGMYRLNISKENSVFINNPPKFGREYKVSLSKKNWNLFGPGHLKHFFQNFSKNDSIDIKEIKKQSKNQQLEAQKQKVSEEIAATLNQQPEFSNSDLSPEYRHWAEKLRKLTTAEAISNLKDRLVADIQARSQEKKATQEAMEDLAKAQRANATAAEKKAALENLEKSEKSKIYAQKASQIKTLKTEQATANPQAYQTEAIKKINQKMASHGVSVAELTSQATSRTQWQQLTSGQISDPQALVAAETTLTQQIFQTEATKKIQSLSQKVQAVLKIGQAEQIAALKKELLAFISASNTYYTAKKAVAQNLLNQLESYSVPEKGSEKTSNKFSLPTKILLGTGISLAILVLISITVRVILSRKRKK